MKLIKRLIAAAVMCSVLLCIAAAAVIAVGAADSLNDEDYCTTASGARTFTSDKNSDGGSSESSISTSEKPSLQDRFYTNFIKDNRYKLLLNGLKNTLIITLFAMILGLIFGFLLAIVRVAHDKNGSAKFLNLLAKLYITVIRGTPASIQLMIIYFVIFASSDIDQVLVAIIAFGINSSAYVAEVVRSGIMSIDVGQFEAGKSLGLKFSTTMTTIILPQAFKNVLPALGNEFISLLKETSVSGFIGLADLTRGGDLIRGITYDAFMPLIAVALIYLVIVIGLSSLVSLMERKLKKNER